MRISEDQWQSYDQDGYLRLGKVLTDRELMALQDQRGLINPDHHSGFLTPEQAREHCPAKDVVHLELLPGEVVLLHNWLLHSSDVNKTDISRRAFSVCYMDARTVSSKGTDFSLIFGKGALTPDGVAVGTHEIRPSDS